MTLMNTSEGWGAVHRAIHWVAAAVILFQLALGFYMVNFITDLFVRFDYTQTHKSWGFIAFALVVFRLFWRRINPRPAPVRMARWQHRASEGAHLALYVLMVALPVSGWLMASASPLQDQYGIQNMVFNWFELPDPFVPGTSGLEKTLKAVHLYCAFAMTAILGVHVLAALKHHYIDRDGLLQRMITGRGEPGRTENAAAERATGSSS
ncbi:MAG: cytochrome b [Pseudomonadota bacterium]